MSRRPDITLISLTSDRILRADYSRRGQAEPVIQSAVRQSPDSATDAIVAALALIPSRPGCRIYVFDDSLPIINLTLPAAQTAGLTEDELSAALAFEAEAFTSLSPANVLLGWHKIGVQQGMAEFQVVQCLHHEMDAIRSALKQVGCRLAGLSHPAALPSAAADDQTAESGTADPELTVAQWLSVLAGGSVETLPLILPPRRTTPVQAHLAFGGLMLAIAIIGCLTHWYLLAQQTGRMEQVLDEGRAAAQQVAQLEKRAGSLRQELATAQKVREDYQSNFSILKARRSSMADLLRVMAGSTADNVVVRRLRTDNEGRTILLGTAWESSATDAFAARLERELEATGWVITPQQRQAQGLLPDSGPWAFALQLSWEDGWVEKIPQSQTWEDQPW